MHFFADFPLQAFEPYHSKMEKKYEKLSHLGWHVLVYGLCITAFGMVISSLTHGSPALGVIFGLFNALSHGVVDFFTSRITKPQWDQKDVPSFFTTIGFDQMVHGIVLILTAGWMLV